MGNEALKPSQLVIATASAGLMVGNFGAKKGMSARTRTALESFWEYIAFVMN